MQISHRPADGERWALIAVANPMQQRTAQTVLEREGFDTVSAIDTDSALAILENQVEPFSLLLVDFNLPGQDSLEVVEVFKYLAGGAQSVAIVRLVEQAEASSVSCLAAGADECLPVPTDTEQLRSTVRRLLPLTVLTQAAG